MAARKSCHHAENDQLQLKPQINSANISQGQKEQSSQIELSLRSILANKTNNPKNKLLIMYKKIGGMIIQRK